MIKPNYGGLSEADYTDRINTPAKNPEYHERFHKPLIDEAKAKGEDRKATVLDIACGHAHELDFIEGDPDIQLVAVDLSHETLAQSTRKRLKNALIACADVEHFPFEEGFADVGILLNALQYKPDKMLQAMYDSLKPGSKCVVNFRIHGNPHNDKFYTYYLDRGGKLTDRTLEVETADGTSEFNLKSLDYTGCKDEKIRHLVKQVYFQSLDDAERLIGLIGFRIISQQPFNFSSPANSNNQINVFTLQKPEEAGDK